MPITTPIDSRRKLLLSAAGVASFGFNNFAFAELTTSASKLTLAPTPACEGQSTPPQMEGPYYTPSSPNRVNLLDQPEPNASPLNLIFKVINIHCEALPDVLVDLWCCDANGRYDNTSHHLRGHQTTDAAGLCRFKTIQPGSYGNAWFKRTPHLHVKVQQPDGPTLTTQLYFPGHPLNAKDSLFDPTLLISLKGDTGQYLFVL